MAYEPKTWVTGEVIEASDLNHMENAIGALYIDSDESGDIPHLLASYNDIISAVENGKIVAFVSNAQTGEPADIYTLCTCNATETEGETPSYTVSFIGNVGSEVRIISFTSTSRTENLVLDFAPVDAGGQ